MAHLPIDVEARKRCDSPEARSARPRRYSIDPAKRAWYRKSRGIRYAARFFS